MKRALCYSLICASPLAYSSTLNIHIEGQQLRFENALSLGASSYTLSDWTVAGGLTPTKRFLPGAYLSNKPDKITLSSASGQNVEAPISVNGLQYNVSSNSYTRTDNALVSPTCTISQVSGNTVHLEDGTTQTCNADFSLDYTESVTPFYFYRPTFNLDTAALLAAFNGKPKGVYAGTIQADIKYYYESLGGALTYRVIPEVFTVNVNYVPNTLESIKVSGDGIMEPVYDTDNHTVSADTTFNITALGQFSTGLYITLLSHDFELKSSVGETTIPFSVTCLQSNCEDQEWIKDGVSQLESDETSYTIDTPSNIINFDLNVSYQDIPSTEVETGAYTGSFTVMFEELY
ncbi:hypothetical protein ACOMICROBIO_LKFPLAJE_01479 [Vibrio sp. B1FIG11]|uniref:hypothetical protein n=1 Tax=Vibrio sp. B1FIG11 TaxID=2751177 RepID=UPI0015F5EDDD|nr:hypothetical protein [Vibrio sp. B1FIG11]CAE6901891.1 hypothetical protein ACOMICROBIO_LKFPLAJE_01479 [Vibrio sp. B1FIG11]